MPQSALIVTVTDPGPDKQYAEALAAGQFRIQLCAGLPSPCFYPRNICPHCGGDALALDHPRRHRRLLDQRIGAPQARLRVATTTWCW